MPGRGTNKGERLRLGPYKEIPERARQGIRSVGAEVEFAGTWHWRWRPARHVQTTVGRCSGENICPGISIVNHHYCAFNAIGPGRTHARDGTGRDGAGRERNVHLGIIVYYDSLLFKRRVQCPPVLRLRDALL